MIKNTEHKKIRVAIFGAGGITHKAYLPLLTTWSGIEIIGIFSRTQDSIDKVCSAFNLCNGTTDAQELIKMKPDAAFVLTNNQTHYKYVKMLLNAGIDVFVEKPITENSQDAQILAQIAEKEKRVLMVGFNRRYSLLYKQAKEIFSGQKIQLAVFQKNRPQATHTSLYNNYLDDTIHQIDLLRFYCGKVEPLFTSYEEEEGKIVGAVSVCKLKDGGSGVIITSLKAGSWQESAILQGENLTVEVDAFEKLTIKHPDHQQVFGTDRPGKWIPDMQERGFYGEIEHFFDCIVSRTQPQTNGVDAVKTLQLIEKLVEVAGLKPDQHPADNWDQIARWDQNISS
ncbi:MAG: Gfo/Idh/MocA family oxidoreductase [Anaerolineaceae bacterium]|nr:Gfo/Idh/MocA family oxidoreductase [Anaerolineaceae bacterium]